MLLLCITSILCTEETVADTRTLAGSKMNSKALAVLVTMIVVPSSILLASPEVPPSAENGLSVLSQVELSTRDLAQQISVLDQSLQQGLSQRNADEVLYVRGQLVALSDRLGELADDLDSATAQPVATHAQRSAVPSAHSVPAAHKPNVNSTWEDHTLTLKHDRAGEDVPK